MCGIKKLLIPFSLFSILILVCVFSACQNIQSFNWQEAGNTFFGYEPHTIDVRESFYTVYTETGKAKYFADTAISEKKLNKTVTNIERILDLIAPSETINFYIYESAGSGFVIESDDNNAVHISPSAKKLDLIIAVLQGTISPYANYGLLYGTASQIHEQLGWGKINLIDDKKIKAFVSDSENLELLDLNYPCFKEEYCNRTKQVKTIAVKFAKYLKNEFGEELLNDLIRSSSNLNIEFENNFTIYMNEFLKTLGGTYFLIPSSQVLRYSSYIAAYPLRVRTVSCDYFITKDYKDTYLNDRGIYFDFNYLSIKKLLCEAERMYQTIRNDFGYTGKDRVRMVLNQNDTLLPTYSAIGLTDETGTTVRMITPWVAVHEYVHTIQIRRFGNNNNWLNEAMAEYYDSFAGYEYSTGRILESNFYKYFLIMDTVDVEQKQLMELYLNFMKNRNLAYNRIDFMDLYSYLNPDISPFSYSALESPSSNTMSFLIFLINNYGIQKVVNLSYMSSSFEYVFEKTSNELLTEWRENLQAKFNND